MTDRRTFLGTAAVTALVPRFAGAGRLDAEQPSARPAAPPPGNTGGPLPLAAPVQAPTRERLASMIAPTPGSQALLSEEGREGVFVWRAGNFMARIAADRRQALFVASRTVPPEQGCWVRAAQGPMMTSWFGVIHDAEISQDVYNPSATDNTEAMQAASDLSTALRRPILLSHGSVMWDGISFAHSFSLYGGARDRGSRIYQRPGSTKAVLTTAAGPCNECALVDLYIKCNGMIGADGIAIVAHGNKGSNGGLWYSRLENIRIDFCNGVALKLWTGDTSGDYVHQFLSISNVVAIRGTLDEVHARALSVAGRLAQCTFRDCEFDAIIDSSPRSGCNVAWGPRYPEGDAYSRFVAGSSSAPLAPGPAVNRFEGTTTIQSDRYGMFIGATNALSLDSFWFESLERALTVTDGAIVNCRNLRFANAASDRIEHGNDIGSGYGIAKDDASQVSVEGCVWAGAIDPVGLNGGGAIRTLPGGHGGGWIISGDNAMAQWDGYTFGLTPVATVTGGVLHLGNDDLYLLPGSSDPGAPLTFNDLSANRRPGACRLIATGHSLWRKDPGKRVDLARSVRLRPGDELEIVVSDSGARHTVIPRPRDYAQAVAPRPGEMIPGEECRNTAATLEHGRFLDRWRCLADGGIVPVYLTTS